MGCDIHVCTEIKVNGEWLFYSQPRIHRNYSLFTKMAGVRNIVGIEPISEPKGLPEDATKMTKLLAKHWELDAHSHSYLTATEIQDLFKWLSSDEGGYKEEGIWKFYYEEAGYLFGIGWDDFAENDDSEDFPEFLEDVRWIFWFDN